MHPTCFRMFLHEQNPEVCILYLWQPHLHKGFAAQNFYTFHLYSRCLIMLFPLQPCSDRRDTNCVLLVLVFFAGLIWCLWQIWISFGQAGERKSINSELWHACAGPLVSLPPVGSLVVYFPQGHSEQVHALSCCFENWVFFIVASKRESLVMMMSGSSLNAKGDR